MGDLTDEMAEADYHGRVDERIAALEAQNTRLREALRPFAEEANKCVRTVTDASYIDGSALTVGDLRRAREALNPPAPKQETEPREGNGA